MTDPLLALALPERQKQCLRLVYENLEAKEVARALALSPHTVNEHLRDARRFLGVARSMQAARLLIEAEGYDRIVSKPIGVPGDSIRAEGTEEPRAGGLEVPVRKNRYGISAFQRLGIIVGLAFGVIALGGALVGTTELVARLITKYRIDISDAPYQR